MQAFPPRPRELPALSVGDGAGNFIPAR